MPPPSLLPTPVVAWQDADLLPFLVLLKAYGTHALGLTGMHTLGGRGGEGGQAACGCWNITITTRILLYFLLEFAVGGTGVLRVRCWL